MKEKIINLLKHCGTVNFRRDYITFNLTSIKYIYYDLNNGSLILYTDVIKTGIRVEPKIYFLNNVQECTDEELEELFVRMTVRNITNGNEYRKENEITTHDIKISIEKAS